MIDHKTLEFFRQQPTLSGRQTHWAEYLDWFRWNITYMKGPHNKVADALSQYYQTDTWYNTHIPSEYASADIQLDRDLDDIPQPRRQEVLNHEVEIHTLQVVDTLEQRRSTRLIDKRKA